MFPPRPRKALSSLRPGKRHLDIIEHAAQRHVGLRTVSASSSSRIACRTMKAWFLMRVAYISE
jgi:hypothetical protein